MNLASRKCVPCKGAENKLKPPQVQFFLAEVKGWQAKDDKLTKTFTFKDFVTAMEFLNKVAEIAEAEGHHPDFAVHYNRVDFTIFTHDVGGLSENDFIIAAKIDELI
jgi:4a-hydroxytetrahydrobiopterin dehydratase